jgi:YD repeat-containing protein
MVAVIAGNGLGLGNTSLRQLGQGLGGQAAIGQNGTDQYLNAATGNLVLQNADEGLIFDGLRLDVLRTYNSQGQLSGNQGWLFGFTRSIGGLTGTLDTAGSTITRTDDDGSAVTYAYNTSLGQYVSTGQSGAQDALSWSATASTWTWTDSASRQQETYNASGQLTVLSDAETGASYSFSYSGGQLSQITAGDGDALTFTYNTSGQLTGLSIMEVPPGQSTAVTRQQVGYAYDAQGRLSTVTTTLGSDTATATASYTTTYTYQGTTDLISSVTQSDGTTVSYTYDASNRVANVTTGTSTAAQTLTLSYGPGSTTVTDSLGNATQYQYDAQNRLISVIAPAVNGVSPTTTYNYDTAGNLLARTDPNGAVTTYIYDTNGNLLSVEDGAGNTVSYTYNANDQVASKTTYTVPAQGEAGQSGYVAPSGAETRYYVYDANNQLAYTIDPIGAVTENDYTAVNGLSELSTTRQYLGATYSLNGLSPSSPPTLTQLQVWVQSSAVQSTLSQSTRTDYTYDVRGQLSTQTRYDTVDANGNGVLTNGAVITTTTYDAQGRLLQTSNETGANRSTLQTTAYAYDGLGRLISRTDPLGQITSYVYTDYSDTLAIIQANGLTTTQVRNNAGQIVSSTQSTSAAIQASSINTAAGTFFTLSSNSTTYTYVRISYQTHYITQPDGTGQWVEGLFATVTVASAQTNAVLYTRLYATPLTAAQFAQVTALPTAATLQSMLAESASDQINLTIYDSNGQQLAQVQYGTYNFTNSDGSTDPVTGALVTTQVGSSQVVRYATPLTVAQLDALGPTPTLSSLQAVLTSSQNDQITLNAVDNSRTGMTASVSFDTNKNVSGVLVSGEYITITQYASTGILSAQTKYATPLTSTQLASLGSAPTVAQIQALITTSAADQTRLYLYGKDSSGRITAAVVPLGGRIVAQNSDGTFKTLAPGEYIAAVQYNSAGLLIGRTFYATPLTAAQVSSLGTSPTAAQIQALITTSAYDISYVGVYDGQNQVQATIAPSTIQNGSGETFGYFVTTGRPDTSGNTWSQTLYGTPLSASQVASLGSSPTLAQVEAAVSPSNSDQVTTVIYNASGQQLAMIAPRQVTITNADGTTSTIVQEHVSTITRDSQGRQTGFREYATPLTPEQVESLGASPTMAQLQALLTPSADDQINLYIYDANGAVAAQVAYQTHYFTNPDGTISTVTGEFATVKNISPTGNVNSAQLYKTPLTAAQMAALGDMPSLTILEEMLANSNQGRLTTYGYDSAGHQISSTDTYGHTSYTFYDANGRVVGTVDASGMVTAYNYDANGYRTQTIQYATLVDTTGWSSHGALTAAFPSNLPIPPSSSSDTTTYAIHDSVGHPVGTIAADGTVTTTTYDASGNAIAVTKYAAALTSAQIGALGSLPTLGALEADLTPGSGDQTSYAIYDQSHRVVAAIDTMGRVTTTSYDGAGNVAATLAYALPLSQAQLSALGGAPTLAALQADLPNIAAQKATLTVYDGSGRVVGAVDNNGYVTTTTYDAVGNVTAVLHYDVPLTATQVTVLGAAPTLAALVAAVGSSATYTATLTLRDSAGRAIGSVDSQGNAVITTYDAAGNVTAQTQFGTPLTQAQVMSLGSAPTLSALRAIVVTGASDQTTLTVYDAQERVAATVTPMHNRWTGQTYYVVKTTVYNASGGVFYARQYSGFLTSAQVASLGTAPTMAALNVLLVPNSGGQDDYFWMNLYDGSGRMVASVQPDYYIGVGITYEDFVLYSYDSLGRLAEKKTYYVGFGGNFNSGNLIANPSLSYLQSIVTSIPYYKVDLTLYDSKGHVAGTFTDDMALGRPAQASLTTYDSAGNPTKVSQYNPPWNYNQTVALSNSPSLAALQAYVGNTSPYATQLSVYDSNERVIGTIDTWGIVSTTSYDSAGRITATTTYATTLTSTQVAALGDAPTLTALQSAVSPSLNDQTTITIHDASGHVVGSVGTNRMVTISSYDEAGNLVLMRQYVALLTYDQVVALAANPTLASLQSLVTPSVKDGFNLAIYDSSNRVVAGVDPYGNVTTTTYGVAGGYEIVTAAATPLTYYQYEELRTNPTLETLRSLLISGQGDSSAITFYDNGDRVVAVVGNDGSVTTKNYDGLGNLTATITAASHLTSLQVHELAMAPSLTALYADLRIDDGDHLSQTIFDTAGHPVAQIDASGYVTTMTYDASGDLVASTQYAMPLPAGHGYFSSLAVLFSELKASSGDKTARTIYDASQHPVASIDASGLVTLISYDAHGSVVSSMRYATALTAGQLITLGAAPTLGRLLAVMGPASGAIYDAAGREVVAINALGEVSYAFHDADGRVTGRVDATGAVIAYTYDADGHVVAETRYATTIATAGWISQGALTANFPTSLPVPVISTDDRTTRMMYDASGQVIATIDPSGHVTANTYDGIGNVIQVTAYAKALTASQLAVLGLSPTWGAVQADLVSSSADRTIRTVYDANHQVLATIDAEGYVTTHAYDAAGHVVSTTAYATALTETQLSAFDASPGLVTLLSEMTRDPGDQSSRNYYDGLGRVVANVDADGYLTTTTYDDTQNTVTATRYATALSATQIAGLSGSESVTVLVGFLGGQSASQKTVTVYDADGQVVKSTTPDGTVTAYAYNAVGQLLSSAMTPAAGQGAGRAENAAYDEFGNTVSSTDAMGAVTTYTYNALGQRACSTDPAGYRTWYYYDDAGRLTYVIKGQPNGDDLNGLGDVTAYTYNAFGEVATTTSYASQLHLTSIVGQVGALDAGTASVAQVASAIAALPAPAGDVNATTTYTYTAQGQLASVVDGDGYQTDYQYDAFGDRIQAQSQVTDLGQSPDAANSEITQYTFDHRGELLSQTDAMGTAAARSTSSQYDAFGRIVSTTDGNGNVIQYAYDGLGRRVSQSQIVQGASRQTFTSYDAFDRVLSQTDALGQVTSYQYDLATHSTTMTAPDGVQLRRVKDAFGDTVSVSDAEGNTTAYTYDDDGRLLTQMDALGAVNTNQYNADGQLIQSTDAMGHVVAYRYDASGRVLTRTVDPQGLNRVTTYAYDGEGRELSVTDPMGVRTVYRYDADGNLLVQIADQGYGATNLVTTYSYDGIGNVLTATVGEGLDASVTQFVYDALNRLTSKVVDPQGLRITTGYIYDANDNLVCTIDPQGNASYAIYNEANELVYSVQPAGAQGSQQGAMTRYGYDADGHRISTRVYATAVATNGLSAALAGGEQASLFAAALLAASASSPGDAVSYGVYSADGRLRYQIDANGVVTETRYNALGQPSEVLVYANPIAISTTLASLLRSGGARDADMQSALGAAGNGDATARATLYYYDANGRVIYTVKLVHLLGVLTAVVSETRYDAAGRVTADVAYGQGLPPTTVGGAATTGSIAQALAAAETATTTRVTQYVYDNAGERVATVDPDGNVTFAFYDGDGRLVLAVDATGDATGYMYDGLGHLVQKAAYATTVDATGWLANGEVTTDVTGATPWSDSTNDRVTLMTYDNQGRLSSVTHDTTDSSAYGDTLTYTYDRASRVVQADDADLSGTVSDRVTRYYYDNDGRVVGTIDANGHLRTQTYDAAGRLAQTMAYATAIDPTLSSSAPLASLIPTTSGNDRITTQYYDTFGNVIGVLDAAGYFTQFTYDADGRQLTSTRYAVAVPGSDRNSFVAVESALTGASSQVVSNQYDSFGDLISTENAEGTVTLRDYDDMGRVVRTTEASGTSDARTTEVAYDALGNVVAITDGLGQVTAYTYDLAGNKLTATDALGNITWYVYDASNRLIYSIRGVSDAAGNANALGEVSESDYDAFGEVTSTEVYVGRITTGAGFVPTWRGMAQAINGIRSSWGGAGVDLDNSVAYYYDSNGNLTSVSDGNGNATSYYYDGFNDRTDAIKVDWITVSTYTYVSKGYTYDGLGRVIDQTSRAYAFDNQGRVINQVDLGEQTWTRDAFGQVVQSTDRDGIATSYTYDALGEELTKSQTVQGVQRQTSTRYDAYGRVLSTADALGLVTSYSYDDANRSLTVTSPGGLVTTTAHNREGQTVNLTDSTGRSTTYSYDKDGRLLLTQNADGSQAAETYDQVGNLLSTLDAVGHLVNYTYDAAGRVLTQTIDPAGLHLVTTYAYDGRGLAVSVTDPQGVITTYSHDGNGNVSQKVVDAGSGATNLNITTTYSYNVLNEVVSSVVSDPQGNSYSDAYQYDAMGRLTYESADTGGAASSSYVYDNDGNLLQKIDGNGRKTYYFYNEAGERIYAISDTGLSEISIPGDGMSRPPATSAVTQYWYDADGHVVASTQYAATLDVAATQQVDALSTQAATRASAATVLGQLASLTTASSGDRTSYAVYNANGQLQFSIDAIGNVTELRYNTKGQVIETLAYGQAISVTPALAGSLCAAAAQPSDIRAALSAAGDTDTTARVTYSLYDSMGRLAFSISAGQAGGMATAYQYDADGNQIGQLVYGDMVPASLLGSAATTDAISQYLAGATLVQATRAVFDNAGRQVYAIDAAGFVTETRYDQEGRVTWTLRYANAIGTPSSWAQADVATAVATTNPDTSAVRGTGNVYDNLGNIVQTLDTLSSTPTGTYTYDARGLKTSHTNRDGQTWTYVYDSNGNLIQETSPPVAVAGYSADGSYAGTTQEPVITQYSYDGDGHPAGQRSYVGTGSPSGGEVQYVYDSNGQIAVTLLTNPGVINPATGLLSSTSGTIRLNTQFNAFGKPVATQDANGNYSYKVYDNAGRLTYELDANGYVTGYTYDAYGEQASVTRYAQAVNLTQLGSSWTPGNGLSVDQLHTLLQPSADDRTLTTTYDNYGNKVAVTQSAVTYTKSDGSTTTGSPETTYTYDAYGNVTSQSVLQQGSPTTGDAVWATTYNYYDALGHKTMSVDPMGYVTTWSYDAFGEVTNTTEWATAMATVGLIAGGAQPVCPAAGNPTTTGTDRITNYTYDNDGNKTSQSVLRTYVNASGATVQGYVNITYGYDGENRVTSVTEDGKTVATLYDALGRISSVSGPQQQVLVANWQALLAANPSLDLSSASLYTTASQVMTYAYDLMGNKLVQTQGSTASTQTVATYYQYDHLNREVASVTPLNGDGLSWASSQAVYKTYDANGNLLHTMSTLDGDDGSTVVVTTSNVYDADNQLILATTSRSGMVTPDKVVATQYDAFGEVTGTGDGVVVSASTTYDNAGNRLTANDPKTGEVHTYGYNLAGQRVTDTVPLSAAVSGTAATINTLDLDGRIIAEQVPATNAASGENAGILHASYDRWGNVLSSTDAAGNTTAYSYNERNQVVTQTGAAMTVVDIHGVSTSITPVKTSSYDAEGNLIAVTDENGNTTSTTVDALGQTVKTVDGTGAVSYVAYDALGNEVADENGDGNITFKNVDALGRVVQQGDFVLSSTGTSRTATWRQAYVLDQDGNRLISYDGIGSADLQSGDTTDAALHANYDGYDSQGRVLWSQDAAQRAASVADAHGPAPAGAWTQAPTNANFADGMTGWVGSANWSAGNFGSGPYGPWTLSYGGTSDYGPETLVNQDRVPVTPGQTITAYGSFVVNSEHGGGSVQIDWYDASGNYLSTSFDISNQVTAGNGPGQVSQTGTAPPGAAYAAIAVGSVNYDLGYNSVYCTGVSWDYVPPAGATSTGANGSVIVWLPGGSFTQQPANPDFENGDTGWNEPPGWSISQWSGAANGSWVASYAGVGPQTLENQDRVPVTAGQSISASAQVHVWRPDGGDSAARVLILWYDASGNLISTSGGNVVTTKASGWHPSLVTGTAPAGAAFAAVGVSANGDGIGNVVVDAVTWNYQYIPTAPTGVVQDTYVYDLDGNLVSQTTADRDTETWQYDAYGRVTTHTDLSGAVYNYTYDANTGLLTGESDNWSPTAQGQSTPAYVTAPISTPNSSTDTYYANGQLATRTYADGSSYSYSYDANGNQVRQESTTVDGNGQAVHTLTTTSYDSHNRISHIVATNVLTGAVTLDETYSYDATGNRREVSAISGGTTVNAWYTYDGANRVAVSDGSLVNGQIVVTATANSYAQSYDADGNVVSQLTVNAAGDTLVQRSTYDTRDELIRADYAVDVTTGGASRGVEETRSYDADGHVLITDHYYALGTVLGARPDFKVDPYDPGSTDGSGTDVGGELDSATIDYYDRVGRLAEEQNFGQPNGWDGSNGGAAPVTAPGVDATTFGSLGLQNEVVYQGPGGSAGYDADGNVVAYQYRDAGGRVDQYAVTYLRKDSYLQSTTSGQNVSNTPNVQPSTDESVYDTRGNLVALAQHTQYAGGTVADTVRVFAYDGNGEIIERRDGTASGATLDQGSTAAHENQHYVYVNGQQVAHYDEGGTLDVLAEVTAFSNSTNGPGGTVVQAGDTLQSIAQAQYGDASLWYVIAQANALSSDNDLAIGQRLTIPQVTTSSNTATTFKPYDPGSIVGSTTPNLPVIAPPPPPPSQHCKALSEVIAIAVTIVVSYYAGPAIGAAAGNLAGQYSAMMFNGQFDWSRAAQFAVNPFSGNASDFGRAIYDPAGNGAPGKADYKSTLIAAAAAEAGSEAGSYVGAVGSTANAVVDAGVQYTTSVELSKAAGYDTPFSLREFGVSMATAYAGAEISQAVGAGQATYRDPTTGATVRALQPFSWELVVKQATADVLTQAANYGLRKASGLPAHWDWQNVAAQVAGNAIGNGINAYQANQLPAIDAPADSIDVTPPAITVSDIPPSMALVGPAQLSTDTVQPGKGDMFGNAVDGYMAASSDVFDNTASDSSYSGPYSGDGEPVALYSDQKSGVQGEAGRLARYFVDPSLTDSEGGGASAGSTDRLTLTANGAHDAEEQLGGYLATMMEAGAPKIDLGTASSADLASYVHDYSGLLEDHPDATNLPAVNVTASAQSALSSGTGVLPPISLPDFMSGIDLSNTTLAVPPLTVPNYVPDIAPIDTGSIQLDQPVASPSLVSLAYSALSSQYRQGELQDQKAGQSFDQHVQQSEQQIDQVRAQLNAYGDSQGGLTQLAAHFASNTAGVYEGAAIGLTKMGEGIVSLANGLGHVTSPYSWAMDPQGNLQRVKSAAGSVAMLDAIGMAAQVDPRAAWLLAKPVVNAATADYRGYLAQGDYSKLTGRAAVEIGTMATGFLGEAGKAGEVEEAFNAVGQAERVVPNNVGATFGRATSTNYRATFFKANPDLEGQVVVHHAVEQQVMTRYPGVVTEEQMHSLENLRGIPNEVNSDLHLSQMRREWNQFYRQTPNATQEQLLQKATEIDTKYGSQFNPPLGQ